jgi:hypothetical protein
MASFTRVGLATGLASLTLACVTELGSSDAGRTGTGGTGVSGDGDGVVPGDGDGVVPGDGDGVVPGDGDGVVTIDPTVCETTIVPGRTPLRRLTTPEYNATVRDLLGDTSAPANNFPPPEESAGFLNNADVYRTTDLHAEAWLTAAEEMTAAYRAAGNLTLPCMADATPCATEFIRDMGKRAFRRPLTDDEVASYLARFDAGMTDGSFEEGLEWVLERMLQSPHFLYRVETEAAGQPAGTVVPLNNYSIATRLSYFLWSTMPDAELLAAADAGQLSTPEQVRLQAERMMGMDRFDETLHSFHAQVLGWEHVYGAPKIAATTPAWDADLQVDMIEEAELFVKSIFDAGGTFSDLLTATHTFVTPRLAQFYGITYPGTGTEFMRVDNVPHRHGLLTQPSILAGHAHPNQSAPVKRGELIRKHLLCTDPPPPPANLVIEIPAPTPDTTTRQRFEEHRVNPGCAGCHVLLDPLGMPFENYDEFGRWRDTDGGQTVDASGGLTMIPSLGNAVDSAEVPVNGPAELGSQLAEVSEAHDCFLFNWFRYSMGRQEEATDTCTIATLRDDFAASGQNLRELLLTIVTSDAFLYRQDQPQ